MNIEDAVKNIEKRFGKEAICGKKVDTKFVSTGSISLDIALGGGVAEGRVVEYMGWESSGKAQPLSSLILTPKGYIKMGEVELGTVVCTPDGGTSTVVEVFPQGEQDVYEFTFDDKSTAHCTLDHLWSVQSRDTKLSHIMTTAQIIERGLGQDHRLLKVPNAAPCYFNNEGLETPMNPYLLGVLLGDGSLQSSITFSNMDEELLTFVRQIIDIDYDAMLSEKRNQCDYGFKKKTAGRDQNGIMIDIVKLGLHNTKSHNKFIPKAYLLSDIESRIALFQGLIDTDGYIHPNQHSVQYVTVSPQLAQDFMFLARSLGMRCVVSDRINSYTSKDGEKVTGQRAYYVNCLHGEFFFQPARISRKQLQVTKRSSHNSRFIESIKLVRREECQCIMIGHPDSLYITDNFVPTHNTTLALHLAAEVQKLGKKVAYIDVEQALDLDYATALGVDCDIEKELPMFYLSQPDCGEDAIEIVREFAKVDDMGLVVIDSVAALVAKSTIQGEAGDAKMAIIARMLSQMIPTLIGPARKSGCIILFISQYREKIGVMFGDPTTTMGGNALKFYASQRLDIARCGQEKEGDEITANKIRVKVKKNKVAIPFKQANFNIEFGIGIDKLAEIIDIGVEFSVIKKSGSWYSYGDSKLGQGAAGVKAILEDNPELREEITLKIYETLGL